MTNKPLDAFQTLQALIICLNMIDEIVKKNENTSKLDWMISVNYKLAEIAMAMSKFYKEIER